MIDKIARVCYIRDINTGRIKVKTMLDLFVGDMLAIGSLAVQISEIKRENAALIIGVDLTGIYTLQYL